MAVIIIVVFFLPVFVYRVFSDPGFFLAHKGWMYPVSGSSVAAVLVVEPFWLKKKE